MILSLPNQPMNKKELIDWLSKKMNQETWIWWTDMKLTKKIIDKYKDKKDLNIYTNPSTEEELEESIVALDRLRPLIHTQPNDNHH